VSNIQQFSPENVKKSAKISVKNVRSALSFISGRFGDQNVQETGRFGLYLGDSWIIRESWRSLVLLYLNLCTYSSLGFAFLKN
jgi:hypothetical protein